MINKIRIILDAEDDVFRDVAVEEEMTLEDFHNVVVQAFGFAGNEMASFYTCNENWEQQEEIALFDMGDAAEPPRLMNEVLLNQAMNADSPKMIYVYDYFNMWTFFVELADVVEKEAGQQYPLLLFSFGEMPAEPPEKNFEADPEIDFDGSLDSYDDLDFDENWN